MCSTAKNVGCSRVDCPPSYEYWMYNCVLATATPGLPKIGDPAEPAFNLTVRSTLDSDNSEWLPIC